MSLPLIIWLVSVASNLKECAIFIIFISLIASAVSIFISIDFSRFEDEKAADAIRMAKFSIIVAIISTITAVLMPSKETSYTMLAAYGVENIISNDHIQGIAENSLKLIEKTISKYADEVNADEGNEKND